MFIDHGQLLPNARELFDNLVKLINDNKIDIIISLPSNKEEYLKQFDALKELREEMYNNDMDKVYDEYERLYNELKAVFDNSPQKYNIQRYDIQDKLNNPKNQTIFIDFEKKI